MTGGRLEIVQILPLLQSRWRGEEYYLTKGNKHIRMIFWRAVSKRLVNKQAQRDAVRAIIDERLF